jgi:subtilisin family serine protease
MNRLLSITLLILILFPGLANSSQNLKDYVGGELIIKFTEELPEIVSRNGVVNFGLPTVDELNIRFGVYSAEKIFPDLGNTQISQIVYDRIGLGRIYRLSVAEEVNILKMVEEYTKNYYVEYTRPNYFIHGVGTFPDDTCFPDSQWNLHQLNDSDIDAPEAWDLVTGDSSIVVAVVDNGIDWDHPDLNARIWINSNETPGNATDDDANGFIDDYRGWDFTKEWPGNVYSNGDDNPMDGNGHGTLAGGIIGAETDNSTGMAGVDWQCKLMPVKILDGSYPGSGTYVEGARGIVYAASNGADIINMSWTCDAYNDTTDDAVQYAYLMGSVLIGASGNDGSSSTKIPASLDEVIAVGATDTSDMRSSYSNYGNHIELVAPGGTANQSRIGIYGTFWNDTYAWKYGTSFAAPQASGVAALMLARNPDLDQEELRTILQYTADDEVGDPYEDVPGWDQYMGYGRLNANRAILMGWSGSTNLTNQSSWSRVPKLAMNHRDIHVVWEDGRDGGSVYYTKSNDGGDNWDNDVSLVPYLSFPDNPDLAVEEKNVYVVWYDLIWGDIYLKKSTDSGENWGSDTQLTNSSGYSSNPAIITYQNDVQVVWTDSRDGNQRIYHKYSTDGGTTWSSETPLSSSGSLASYDADIAVHGQDVYVVWYQVSATYKRVYFRHSGDGGSSWDAAQSLDDLTTSTWITPQIDASIYGVHTVWSDFVPGGNEEVDLYSSYNKGQTWIGSTVTADDGSKSIGSRVSVFGENVHIDWVDWRDRAGDLNEEIYFREGHDSSSVFGWDTPEWRLTGNSARSSQSSIDSKGDEIHVVWSDARDGNDEIYYNRYSPWVTVSITPDSSIVEVPRNGSMGYTAKIINHTSVQQSIVAWIDVTLPNGNQYGPLLGPVNLSLQPNQERTIHLNENIPGNAPYFTYTYNGYVGYAYPDVLDFDSFIFTVVQSGLLTGNEKLSSDVLDFSEW